MPFRLFIAVFSLVLAVHTALAADTGHRPVPAHAAAAKVPAVAAGTAIVNVNRATLAQLVTLKGIGEKKARAILAWRREHGPFNSLEQFEEVPGIGPALIEQNRERIVFR